jgi:rare lipoprotein A
MIISRRIWFIEGCFQRGVSQIHVAGSSSNIGIAKALLLTLWVAFFLSVNGCGKKAHHVGIGDRTSKKLMVLPERKTYDKLQPYVVDGQTYYPIPSAEGFVQEGLASWYGKEFHGRPTASGEVFDMYYPSAAHKTLPLGTHVRVANLASNTEIIVRINDRGPFVKGRIIDLSYAAAKDVGLLGPGVAPVRIEALARQVGEVEEPMGLKRPVVEIQDLEEGLFTVQVGAFGDRQNALRLADRLMPHFGDAEVSAYVDKDRGTLYRVRVSKARSLTQASRIEQKLEAMGFAEAFIIAL